MVVVRVYANNKLGSQIFYSLVCKFNVYFIRSENLVYQHNPFIIYAIGQSSIQHATLSQLDIAEQVSSNISFSINIIFIEI